MHKFFYIVLLVVLCSCSINYSFTGAAISPETKTVSVTYFRNIAPLINPKLSDQFTEALRDKLVSETRLRLTTGDADLTYEGEITGYDQSYQGVQASEKAAQNKLTITIKVKYTNAKEPQKNFEKPFSASAVYASSESLSSVEDQLVKQINNDIHTAIFSATVADW
jgi:hypothetical protein